jgi:hypothetical protein
MALYYIGDPCYVLTDEQIAEGDYYSFDTAHGDGIYWDDDDNRYGVDSGCLACIEVDDITEVDRLNEILDLNLAHTFEFDDLLADDCSYAEGVITFGGVAIDTN